ncbi:DOMON domain-containing protein frrs1L [Irineochytrium annulatum]|nr:DOMON domain-containing protein frrs1L [Irineochytrium annulatum]
MFLRALSLLAVVVPAVLSHGTVCFDSNGNPTSNLADPNSYYCITADGDAAGKFTTYTVNSAAPGWAGLGAGTTTMSGGDVAIGYANTSGGVSLYAATTYQYGVRLNRKSAWTQLPLSGTPPSWARISFTASRPNALPAGNSGQSVNPSPAKTGYIFAYSSRAPSGSSPASLSVPQHDFSSSFTGDLSAPSGGGNNSTGGNGTDPNPLVVTSAQPSRLLPLGPLGTDDRASVVHGALMFVAWCVSPFLGIFVARFLKDLLGVWWFRIHVFLMLVVTGSLTIAGFLVKFLTRLPPHFRSPHEQIGLAIVCGLVVQVIMGFVSNALWSPGRMGVPWWDKAHWWLGRGLFLLGIVNVYLGMYRYNDVSIYGVSTAVVILCSVWIGLGFVAMVIGQVRFGQVHHVQGNVGRVPSHGDAGGEEGKEDNFMMAQGDSNGMGHVARPMPPARTASTPLTAPPRTASA